MSDLVDLHTIYNDSHLMRYWINGYCTTLTETQVKMEEMVSHWDEFGFGDWILINKSNNQFIGFCGIEREFTQDESVNLGFAIQSQYCGKGYATEAALLVIDFSFSNLLFNEIVAFVHPDNVASIKVLEKCSMSFKQMVVRKNCNRLLYHLKNSHVILSSRRCLYNS